MALKVELKAGERFILGECVITNCGQRTRLTIDGRVPILREKDIMTAGQANTPAKRIYLVVQLMYLAKYPAIHHTAYFGLLGEILRAAPSMLAIIENINNQILTGNMYKALKAAKKLIEYEEELVAHAQRRTSLSNHRQASRQSA